MKSKFFNALVIALIVFQAVSPISALAYVGTDLPDYAPGSVVTISGDNSDGVGFLAGETVTVEVWGPNGYHVFCDPAPVADDTGAWSCQVVLWDSPDAIGNYSYTANGQTSGVTQSGIFTDAAIITTATINIYDWENCSNIKTTFVLGETPWACVNVTGLGSGGVGLFYILWVDPSSTVLLRTWYFPPSSVPTTFVESFPMSLNAPLGVYTVKVCNDYYCTSGNLVVSTQFTIRAPKTTPTITFGAAPTPTYLGGNFTVNATTTNTDSSVLTYSWVSGPCALVDANTGTFSSSGAGTCVVNANGVETTNFRAASQTQAVIIGKATQTTPTVTGPSAITYGNTGTATATGGESTGTYSFSAGTSTGCSVLGTTVSVSDASGTCSLTVTKAGDNNYLVSSASTPSTVTLNKATAAVTLSDLTQIYTGSSLSPTAATNPSGLTVVFTYDGSATAPINAGDYAVVATINDANYQGSASGTLHVLSPFVTNTPPVVSVTGVTDGASYEFGSVPVAGCSVVDAEDGNSTFPATLNTITGLLSASGIGNQTASCSYTDGGGLSISASATYSIVDTTAPIIAAHADVTAEATSASGAIVSYTSPATADLVDGAGTATCAPISGSTFDLGGTTVTCNATDASGNAATQTTFVVHVVDTTTPVLHNMPADKTVEGNTTGGANVSFTAPTATDIVDPAPAVACVPASGSFFALGGPHTVTCTATDASKNSSSNTFYVTVVDTTPPSITCPANIVGTVGQSVLLGSPVVSDIVDASPIVTNNAPSSFGPGKTEVTWTATDHSGNAASCTQSVTLKYVWLGFFQPIDMGMLNVAKAGSTIPVKWALKDANSNFIGDLGSFASLTSHIISCSSSDPLDDIEQTVASGGSVLRYDSTANQFIYNWSTLKSWALTCRQLVLLLKDGTTHTADFKFK